jgi:PAS domain S-box-containing protein
MSTPITAAAPAEQGGESPADPRLGELFEQFPVSIQIFSPDGRTRRVNRAYTRLWGLEMADLDGFDPRTDPQLEPVRTLIQRGFSGEPVQVPPLPFDTATLPSGRVSSGEDGGSTVRWVEASIFPIRDSAGGLREVVLVHRDVTGEKLAHDALRDSEAGYRTLFESTGDAIYVLDPESGAILDVNPAACELHGYGAEEMRRLGIEGLSDGRPPFDWDHALGLIRLAAAGEPQRLEWLGRHREGGEVWGDVTLRPVLLGGARRVLATVRVITDQKRAEEALRASEENYRTIFQNSSDAIWLHDLETGEMLDVNEAGCEMFGYTFAELMAAGHDALIYPGSEFTPARIAEYMARAVEGGTPRFEWMGRHRAGHAVWGEVTLRRVSIGGRDRILATVRDITQRVEAEEARGQAERDAQTMASRMRAVAGAAAALIGADSVDALLPVLREACAQVISLDAFWLSLYDERDHTFTYSGYDLGERIAERVVSAAGTPSERVLHRRTSILTHRASDPDAAGGILLGTHRRSESIIRAPIMSGSRLLGVISVQSYTPGLYDHQDVEVLEAIASLAATALLNIELYEERKAAEEALLRANEELEQRVAERTAELSRRTEELEAIFHALPDLYFRLAPDGMVLEHRAGGDESLVLPPEVYQGRTLPELLESLVPDEAAARIHAALDEVRDSGRLVCVEYPLVLDGEAHEFEARLLRLQDASLIAVVRDITDRKRTERELQDREEHFRRLIENAQDLLLVIDGQARIRYASPSVERILGYRSDELVGMDGFALVHPDDTATSTERLQQTIDQPGTSVVTEVRLLARDGGYRVMDSYSRTVAPDSAAEGIVINARDITERAGFERALRESEEHFRSLIENGSDLIVVVGPDGTNRYVSPSVRKVLGYTPEEVIGLPSLNDLIHPDGHDAIREVTARASANPGVPCSVEFAVRHRDGSWRIFETVGRTLRDDTAADGFVINARDVTERRRAEGALRDSEARYRSLIDNAHDIVTLTGLDGVITYQSPQLRQVLGWDPEEMIGRNALDFVHPDDVAVPADALKRMLDSPEATFISEYRFRHQDGGWRYLETYGRALVADDLSQGFVFNTRDVTERREAQQALREREEHFRRLIETSHDLVQTLDPGGRIIYTGPSVERLLGYTPEEIAGDGADRFIHPDDRPMIAAELGRAMRRPGTIIDVEYRVLHKDGRWRWFEALARTLSPDTAEHGIVANARDITERREAEHALQEREEHFRRLIEKSGDMIQLLDGSGRITYTGPSVERLLGYTPERIEGTEALSYLHPDDIEKTAEALGQMLSRPEEVITAEYRVRHAAGHYRVFEAFARSLHAPDGSQVVVVNARDITDRREAEVEIERQRAYFEQLLASVDAGLAAWDAQGRYEYVSPNSIPDETLREWVVGRTIADCCDRCGIAEPVADQRQQSVERAIRTRQPTEYEETIPGRNGTAVHLLRRNRPILDEHGEVVRVIGYSVDITERKRTEEAVKRATEEAERAREAAERANRAKSEFLSRMSHELRTPMNSILGFAQLLDRTALPADQKKSVGHILKAGRHLLQLINEVLEIARIEAGRHNLSLEPVQLSTVVGEAVALVRPLAAQWQVEVDETEATRLPDYVRADRQRLTQVLLNLLSNAIKYNRAGGRVRIRTDREDQGDEIRLVVRIEDSGRGIAPERVDQLFTPFARLGAEQSEVEGTGLGLALSQRLTEAMGGALELERTSPAGSVFRITLRPAEDPMRTVADGDGQAAALDGAPHAPATLLYVEDNLANLTLVESILASRPLWRTLPALQGQLGVELAREHRPDLILLDLHLPDINGEEVLRRLRSDRRTASIPVVVITADATRTAVERLRDAGADAYLTKPLDIDEFIETVERFLPTPDGP